MVFQNTRPSEDECKPRRKNFHKYRNREIPIILLEMDDDIGYSISKEIPNLIPISKICSDTKIKGKYFRFQLPLNMAHCSTTHKRQGVTAKNGAVIRPTEYNSIPFARGLEYVQLSRARKLEDIYIIGNKLHKNHFQCHNKERELIAREYQRLEQYKNYL